MFGVTNLVQSVQRALDIIDVLAGSPQSLTLKTIADTLGLKSPTVHRLAGTLLERGYIRKDGHGRYAMGPRVAQLAQMHLPVLPRLAEPLLLETAARAAGASVVLAEFIDGEVRATLEINRTCPAVAERPAARALHPYSSASALAFQAYLPPERLAEYRLRYPFSEFAHRLWTDPAELDAFLSQVRQTGVLSVAFPNENILKVAVPVMSPSGSIAGVVAASMAREGPLRLSDPDALAPLLIRTAKNLSETLGSRMSPL